jgi:uncharacterized protein (TIGR03000 family)
MSRQHVTRAALAGAVLAFAAAEARALPVPPQPGQPPRVTTVISSGYGGVPGQYRAGNVPGFGTPAWPPPFGVPTEAEMELRLGTGPAPAEKPNNTALLTIQVPEAAELYLQGQKMDLTGTERRFASPALEPGKSYTYDVVVRWAEDGKPVERTKKVLVWANDSKSLAFMPTPKAAVTAPPAAPEPEKIPPPTKK